MTDKELNKIADLIKARATFDDLAAFKHLEQREDRTAWVKNQIAKLEKGNYCHDRQNYQLSRH